MCSGCKVSSRRSLNMPCSSNFDPSQTNHAFLDISYFADSRNNDVKLSHLIFFLLFKKCVVSERFLFYATTDAYFVCYIWRQIAWHDFLHSLCLAFSYPNKIEGFTIYDGDKNTKWLSLLYLFYLNFTFITSD